jgi:hypothetical protein
MIWAPCAGELTVNAAAEPADSARQVLAIVINNSPAVETSVALADSTAGNC